MEVNNHKKFFFLGVTTHNSSVIKLFSSWCSILGIADCDLIGIDRTPLCELQEYNAIIVDNYLGGLVTTHKARLYEYFKHNNYEISTQAELLEEISCVKFKDSIPYGMALDSVVTSKLLSKFIETKNWKQGCRDVVIIGGGGAGVAFANSLSKISNEISTLHIIESNAERFIKIKNDIFPRFGFPNSRLRLHNLNLSDDVIKQCGPGTFIVNASGVGKDYDGIVISSNAALPIDAIIWDFNYRGNLRLITDSAIYKYQKNLIIEDGWNYFISGWLHHMCEVFEIPYSEGMHIAFSQAAKHLREQSM